MAIVKGKGSVLKHDIAATLTAVAQVISINHSGAQSETFRSTSLDTSGAGHTYTPTGYAEPGTVDFELFFDPALAGHQIITDYITTPATQAHSITFADAGTSAWEYTVAGQTFGVSVAMDDGVKATVSQQLTGLMAYDT